jgi:hypothetical protein
MKIIWLKSGDPVFVDDEDYPILMQYEWSLTQNIWSCNKYASRGRKPSGMHRFIMNTPKGLYTDHINHNGLDNRRVNLRIVTASQNQLNLKKNCLDCKNKTHDYNYFKIDISSIPNIAIV